MSILTSHKNIDSSCSSCTRARHHMRSVPVTPRLLSWSSCVLVLQEFLNLGCTAFAKRSYPAPWAAPSPMHMLDSPTPPVPEEDEGDEVDRPIGSEGSSGLRLPWREREVDAETISHEESSIGSPSAPEAASRRVLFAPQESSDAVGTPEGDPETLSGRLYLRYSRGNTATPGGGGATTPGGVAGTMNGLQQHTALGLLAGRVGRGLGSAGLSTSAALTDEALLSASRATSFAASGAPAGGLRLAGSVSDSTIHADPRRSGSTVLAEGQGGHQLQAGARGAMIGPSGGPPGVGIESASQDPPSYAFFPSFWSGNSGQQVESNEASTDTLPAQDRSLYRRGGAAPGGARRRGHERRDDTRTTGTSGSLFLSATMSSLASSLGSMFHQNFRLGNPHPEHQVLDDPEMNGGGGTTSQGLASSSNALLGTSTRELRMSNHLVQRQASGNPSNFSDPPDDEDQGLQVVGPATSNQEDLSASRQSTRSEPTACAICLSADQNRLTGPKVRVQACGHQTLHLLCLNDWVQRGNSRRCPICRAYMGAHWVNSNIIQRVQREGDLYGAEAIERIMREEEAARLVAQQAGEPSSTTSGVDNDQLPGVDINDAAAIATSEHEIIHLGIPPGPVGSRDTSGDAHAATSRGALLSSSRGVGFSSGTTRGGGPTYVAPSATTSASPGDDETGLNGTPYGTIRRQFRRLGALRMQRRNRDNISTMSDPDSSSASLFAAAAIESSSDPSSSYNRMNIRSAVLVPAPRQISMEGSPTPSSGGNRLAQSGSTVHRNPDRQMRFNELALENVNGLRQYEDLEAASAEDDPDERTRPMSGMRPQNNELRFLEFERECTLLRELFFDCCIMEICCKNAKCWAGICVAGCIGCCYQDQRWVEGEREVCMQNYFPEYSVPDYMTRGFSHYNEGGSHILFTLRDYLDDENRTRDDAQYGHGGGRGHLPHGGAGAPDAKTFAEAQADEVVIDPNNESVSSSAVLPSNSDTSSARSPSESSTSDVAPPAGARSLRAGQVVHPGHLDWHPHGNSQRDGNDDEERHHHMHFENYRFVSDEEARQHVDEQRWDALKRHFGLKESDFSQELIYLRCMAKPGPGFIDSQLRMRDHDKKSGREYSGREDDTRQKVYYETVGHERRQGSSPWSEDDEGTDVKNGGAQEEHERDKDARRSSQSSPEGTLLRHRLRGSTDVAASSNESTKTSSAGRNRPTEEASSAPDAGARIKTE